ncbi:MAG: hypothetical protein K0S07_1593, partial [Chlamydiales bacterium]|nr:hypothetical protein [Chlamydiales bacterium]
MEVPGNGYQPERICPAPLAAPPKAPPSQREHSLSAVAREALSLLSASIKDPALKEPFQAVSASGFPPLYPSQQKELSCLLTARTNLNKDLKHYYIDATDSKLFPQGLAHFFDFTPQEFFKIFFAAAFDYLLRVGDASAAFDSY